MSADPRMLRRVDLVRAPPIEDDADEADERGREILCTVLQGPAPCDSCPFAARCRDELLACQQFRAYCIGLSELLWRDAQREPTREIFAAVFDDSADDRKPGRPRKEAEAANAG
ncbi:MAG: hypothetical protein WCA14_13955 [Steroidobacteraceae bacterium]